MGGWVGPRACLDNLEMMFYTEIYLNAIRCCVVFVLLDQIMFHLKLGWYSNKMMILKATFSFWQML
jgi:hypothetical protein